MRRKRAILIAGPTAGGKSALALRLAERLGGVVVNADAMAVYRDLAIVTGRPGAGDLTRAPHRLFGHIDAAASHSVGRWLGEADATLRSVWADAALPIVVGGTGLYFKALVEGLSDIPPVPDEIRKEVRAAAEGQPPDVLHARLASRDPQTAAHLRPTDRQRILRALEVHEATGRSLSGFQARRSAPVLPLAACVAVVVDVDRAFLRGCIDRRFDRMMAEGALQEVKALAQRSLDPTLPAMRALGVPPLLAHLAGSLPLDDAVSRVKSQTRAYAKRQDTFARSQLASFTRTSPEGAEHLVHTALFE